MFSFFGLLQRLFEDQIDLLGVPCAALLGRDTADKPPAVLGTAVDDGAVISDGVDVAGAKTQPSKSQATVSYSYLYMVMPP